MQTRKSAAAGKKKNYLIRQHSLRIIRSSRQNEPVTEQWSKLSARPCCIHLLKATHYLAKSSFLLVDDYYFPIYVVNLRKGTEVIQVWHACGAFKKFGYSVLGKSYGADDNYVKYVPIHKNYSHVLVSSKEVIPHYAEAFNMDPSRIHPMGIPRTDLFFNDTLKTEAIERVYHKYPELKGKKLVLYAPTFRGVVRQQIDVVMPFDLKQATESLGEDMILGLKMHPFVSKSFDLEGLENVINLSDYPEVNDLLLVTDLLISDYSSLVFEFSLLERPMIFYAHDRVDYIAERDFYYEYESFVPGPIVETTEELIHQLKSSNFDLEKVKAFKSKFFDRADGKVTQRFIHEIILKYQRGF